MNRNMNLLWLAAAVCSAALAQGSGTPPDPATMVANRVSMLAAQLNLTGWPAAVIRCGQAADGLPIGVQIAAAPWREDLVLAVALLLEREFGGWQPAPCL